MDEDESTSLYDKFSDLLNKGLEGYKTYTAEQQAQANEDLANRLAEQNKTANQTPAWLLPVGIGAAILVGLLIVASLFTGKKN